MFTRYMTLRLITAKLYTLKSEETNDGPAKNIGKDYQIP
jgi:hypothetical protein